MRMSITYKSFKGWDEKDRRDYLYSRTNIQFEDFPNFENGICQAVKIDNGVYWSNYSDTLESFLPMKHDMTYIKTLDYGSITDLFPQNLIILNIENSINPKIDNIKMLDVEDFLLTHHPGE